MGDWAIAVAEECPADLIGGQDREGPIAGSAGCNRIRALATDHPRDVPRSRRFKTHGWEVLLLRQNLPALDPRVMSP